MNNYYLNSIDKLDTKKIIFFGTGGIGQKFYRKYCLENNLLPRPIYWCDNNKTKYNTRIDNIQVISPEILKKIIDKDYAIIITTGVSHMLPILSQLQIMGFYSCDIYSSQHLDAYFYFNSNYDKFSEVSEMFFDQKSKIIYKSFVNNLISGRPVAFDLFEPNQYFDNDVIPSIGNNEIMVDAGVCKGEEIDKAISMNFNIKVHAFEPHPASMVQLKEKYKENKHIILHENALWNKNEKLFFDTAILSSGARIVEKDNDSLTIQAIKLDEAISVPITLIKMDIEGAEQKALMGAEKLIRKYHPKLAICSYHKVEDYIEIPLLIKNLDDKYKLYFRQHSASLDESVVYAI